MLDDGEQVFLFLLQEFLGGEFFLGIALGLFFVGGGPAGADVGELLDCAVGEGVDEEVVRALVGDLFCAREEAGLGFDVACCGEAFGFVGGEIVEPEVAGLRVEALVAGFVVGAVLWWGETGFRVGELDEVAAVAVDDVGVEGCRDGVGVALPVEVEFLTIAGPAETRWGVAAVARALHDRFDRQFGLLRLAGQAEDADQRNSNQITNLHRIIVIVAT